MKTGQCTRQFCISNVNHLESTFVPASNYVYLASAARRIKHSFDLKATLRQGKREAQSNALLDCGAYSCFAHYRFDQAHGLELKRLSREVRVFNADATENKKGLITHYIRCQVSIGNHTSWQSFLVTDIGRQVSQPTRLRHQTNKDKAYWWLNQQGGKHSKRDRLPNLNRLRGRGY